ncbi:phosphotransferase [Actinomadura hibisca]|uniref:phosphotransferase n=1 Tax=Actinomadura hibisca TaxID=68565 RepID=UPI000832D4A9|nr:phosphotransferase [Actinomadura hibisca]
MPRSAWGDLPQPVRDAVQEQVGAVAGLVPAPSGNHAHIAGTLRASSGPVFVKGARKEADRDGPEIWSLRNEARINPHVQPYAPRLLWTVEEAGWLLLGFEYVEARHADYTPGSPDLAVLTEVLEAFQAMAAPDAVVLQVERRWQPVLADVSAMAGGALLHADLNPANLLITPEGRACVVDWAFTSRGAAWVELALLIPWLLKAGHSPDQVARWSARFPSWAGTDPTAIDLLAWAFAESWRRRSSADPAVPWKAELAALGQQWADHRRARPPGR